MKSVYGFVIKPKGKRYNNTKKIGGSELIVNTEIFNHKFVNREAVVISCPIVGDNFGIRPGDTVIVHHNVFRRWHDMKGRERNSKAFFNEDTYIVSADQIFLYKNRDTWYCLNGYCFVNPIESNDKYSLEKERPLMGIVEYTDGSVDVDDLVGFRPNSEYEFVFEGKRLYRVFSHFITIKYEYKGDEKKYNPSWT